MACNKSMVRQESCCKHRSVEKELEPVPLVGVNADFFSNEGVIVDFGVSNLKCNTHKKIRDASCSCANTVLDLQVYLGFGGVEKMGDPKCIDCEGAGIISSPQPLQGRKYCKYSSSKAK